MKLKTTFNLFVLVCILGVSIWILELNSRKPGELGPPPPPPSENVEYLLVENQNVLVECVKKDGLWFLNSPVRAKADEGAIDRILSSLESLPRVEIITAKQRRERELPLKAYIPERPRARFIVGEKTARLETLVGCDAPVGDLLYIKFRNYDDVIAVPQSITNLLPQKVEDMRDRFVLRGDPARVAKFEIHRPGGFIQMARVGEEWQIQQPFAARADPGIVRQLLNVLFSLKVQLFVWDPPLKNVAGDVEVGGGDVAKDAQYELERDTAATRLAVWMEGDEVGTEVIIGKQVPGRDLEVYAKRKELESIYTVNKGILDVFSIAAQDLRDRYLFPYQTDKVMALCFEARDKKIAMEKKDIGWVIREPVQWKADDETVSALVALLTRLKFETFGSDLTTTNLDLLGLSQPALIIGLSTNVPAVPVAGQNEGKEGRVPAPPANSAAAVNRFLIGSIARNGKVCAKFENGTFIGEMSQRIVQFLCADRLDPMIYRDRTVVTINSKTVKKISLAKGGTEQIISLDSNGVWQVIAPSPGVRDDEVLSDLLLCMANLRALRIESCDLRNPAAYGVDGSCVTLTFGLSGEGGIQKTMFLGFRAKTDGIYALIQGQDMLFVLRKDLARILCRDLVKPKQKEGGEAKVSGGAQ